MILDDLKDVCLELRNAGVDYVVVGGAAIERHYRVGTMDLDFAIALKDYTTVLTKMASHPRVRDMEDLGTIAGCKFRVETRWVDVEFINPKLFCGKSPPDHFIDYVRRYRSEHTDLGPCATPPVVWYMRLAVPDWQIYVQKIIRDFRAGVPEKTLEDAVAIAAHFGIRELIESRVRQAREMIELARPR
jgi:hypothetical protein